MEESIPIFKCIKCGKVFKNKRGLTMHEHKKIPCNNELKPEEKELEVESNNNKEDSEYLKGKIRQAHQILYEAENIEGESAMNDIMNLLFLKLIEDKLSDKEEDGKIDLKN